MMDHRYGKVERGGRTVSARERLKRIGKSHCDGTERHARLERGGACSVHRSQMSGIIGPEKWRVDLFELIAATPKLDWQLVTKRPENISKSLPPDWDDWCPNVWLGMTAEDHADLAVGCE